MRLSTAMVFSRFFMNNTSIDGNGFFTKAHVTLVDGNGFFIKTQ